MKILEEFWYGNIDPTEYDTSSKEYKKLLELICRNEEKLKATMNSTPFVRQYGILLTNGVLFYAKRSAEQEVYWGIQTGSR